MITAAQVDQAVERAKALVPTLYDEARQRELLELSNKFKKMGDKIMARIFRNMATKK